VTASDSILCPQCFGTLSPVTELLSESPVPPRTRNLYRCDRDPYHLHWVETAEEESLIDEA
jgi:hypothetical protein